MLKYTRNTNNCEVCFYKLIYIAIKPKKMLDTQNCPKSHIKDAKTTKFVLQSAFFTCKERTCKVLPFYAF